MTVAELDKLYPPQLEPERTSLTDTLNWVRKSPEFSKQCELLKGKRSYWKPFSRREKAPDQNAIEEQALVAALKELTRKRAANLECLKQQVQLLEASLDPSQGVLA